MEPCDKAIIKDLECRVSELASKCYDLTNDNDRLRKKLASMDKQSMLTCPYCKRETPTIVISRFCRSGQRNMCPTCYEVYRDGYCDKASLIMWITDHPYEFSLIGILATTCLGLALKLLGVI